MEQTTVTANGEGSLVVKATATIPGGNIITQIATISVTSNTGGEGERFYSGGGGGGGTVGTGGGGSSEPGTDMNPLTDNSQFFV